MVHTSIMTASMAGEEQLVFHDFLGMACHRGDSIKHSDIDMLDASLKSKKDQIKGVERGEVAMKTVSTSSGHFDDCSPSIVVSEQLSWPQGTGGSFQAGSLLGLHKPELTDRHAKRRDIASTGDFMPQQLQRVTDATETSPHLKVSRFEKPDDRKIGHVETAQDFMHSPMQPPRVSSSLQSLHPSYVIKPGVNMAISNKWDNSKHFSLNNCMFGPVQAGHLNLNFDKLASRNLRENNVVVPRPPADEGSRTGLKGSSAGILLNSNPTNPLPGTTHAKPSSGRSKSWSQSAGSECMYAASQQTTTPTSRQLTIFYGGQAHVFEDVPSDKADAIMTLAGSSGRSWSTMYTPRPKASIPGSGSEGPQSTVDRDKSTSKSSAIADPGLVTPEVPNVGCRSAPPRSNEIQREGLGVPTVSDGRGIPLLRSVGTPEIRKELF